MPKNITPLESKLGFSFKNKSLLLTALTHKSYSRYASGSMENNERLEFFGDAVLKLLVSEYLYNKYPTYDEGMLTKIRAQLISDRSLSQLAQHLNLGDYILFSRGEARSGGKRRSSNLANALEAVLGACYLDRGLAQTQSFFVPLLDQFFGEVASEDQLSDYKTKLQEYLQQRKQELPDYQVIQEVGPDHNKEFHIQVHMDINGQKILSKGKGKTKKDAEQQAAKQALNQLDSQ